jgi:hypothetical protein
MAADYKVMNPTMETAINEAGTGFVTNWKIPYVITDGPAKGTRGHVLIPSDQYNADNAHQAIAGAVAMHHAVMSR